LSNIYGCPNDQIYIVITKLHSHVLFVRSQANTENALAEHYDRQQIIGSPRICCNTVTDSQLLRLKT